MRFLGSRFTDDFSHLREQYHVIFPTVSMTILPVPDSMCLEQKLHFAIDKTTSRLSFSIIFPLLFEKV